MADFKMRVKDPDGTERWETDEEYDLRLNPVASRPKSFDIDYTWPDYVPDDRRHPINDSPTKSLKECECGAKHTSFPDSHLSFCPMKE